MQPPVLRLRPGAATLEAGLNTVACSAIVADSMGTNHVPNWYQQFKTGVQFVRDLTTAYSIDPNKSDQESLERDRKELERVFKEIHNEVTSISSWLLSWFLIASNTKRLEVQIQVDTLKKTAIDALPQLTHEQRQDTIEYWKSVSGMLDQRISL